MEENSDYPAGSYFILDPPSEPIAGCIAIVTPTSKYKRIASIENDRTTIKYKVRGVVSDNVPLNIPLEEILAQTSTSLLTMSSERLSWNLHFGGRSAFFIDLQKSEGDGLAYLEVEVETAFPLRAFLVARSAINDFLDVLMRETWMPLVILRLDLYIEGEDSPIAHQCIWPYTNRINFQYGGGYGKFSFFQPYEALIREAISATSPYYRLLCAHRLYDGVKVLRVTVRDLAKQFSVKAPLPSDRKIDLDMARGLGFPEEYLQGVRTANDLFGKLTEMRNSVAHFLLTPKKQQASKNSGQVLHFSNGYEYRSFSLAAALMLHYAHLAIEDLWRYTMNELHNHLRRGSILAMQENRDMFILRPDQYDVLPSNQNNQLESK